jgi:hypothetical protein
MQTIESTREKDETFVDPEDEDVLLDEADDEFAGEGGWGGGITLCLMLSTLVLLAAIVSSLALRICPGLLEAACPTTLASYMHVPVCCHPAAFKIVVTWSGYCHLIIVV